MTRHAYTKTAALCLGLTYATAVNAQGTDHNPVDECIENNIAIMETDSQARALHDRTLREQHNPYIRRYNSVTPENDYREFVEPVNGQGARYMIDLKPVNDNAGTAGQQAYKLMTVWYLPVDYDALANRCTFETGGEYLGRKAEWPPAIKGIHETEFTID